MVISKNNKTKHRTLSVLHAQDNMGSHVGNTSLSPIRILLIISLLKTVTYKKKRDDRSNVAAEQGFTLIETFPPAIIKAAPPTEQKRELYLRLWNEYILLWQFTISLIFDRFLQEHKLVEPERLDVRKRPRSLPQAGATFRPHVFKQISPTHFQRDQAINTYTELHLALCTTY